MVAKDFRAAGDIRVKKVIKDKKLPRHFFANIKKIFKQECSPEKDNDSTARRCAALQKQDPKRLIRFMLAYPPTVWQGGRTMDERIFARLLGSSELNQESQLEPELLTARFFPIVLRQLEVTGVPYPQVAARVVDALNHDDSDDWVSLEAIETRGHAKRERYSNQHDESQESGPAVEKSHSQNESYLQVLLGSGRHAHFPGAQKSKVGILQELLLEGLQTSRLWGEEASPNTNCVQVFVPRNSDQDDGIVTLTLNSSVTWTIMAELGLLSR